MPNTAPPSPVQVARLGRRINLGDAMILVIAMAAAVRLVIVCDSRYSLSQGRLDPGDTWNERVVNVLFVLNVVAISLLMTLSPLMLWMRLRRPRPGLHRVLREYGTVACLVATSMIPLSLRLPFEWELQPVHFTKPYLYEVCLVEIPAWAPDRCGAAVIGAWLAMAIGRSGRRGDAVERLGFVVGVGWCFTFLSAAYQSMSGFFD